MRDLGVVFSSSLSFEAHVNRVCSKASKCLGLILRVSRYFQQPSILRLLYTTFVRPHLEYSSVVWSPHQKFLIDRVESIQRRFVRIVGTRLGFRYMDVPVSALASELCLPSLDHRRRVQDVIFLARLINGSIDCPVLLEKINFRIPAARTRSRELFARVHHGTSYERSSAMNRIQLRANHLPPDVDLFHQSIPAIRRGIRNVSLDT